MNVIRSVHLAAGLHPVFKNDPPVDGTEPDDGFLFEHRVGNVSLYSIRGNAPEHEPYFDARRKSLADPR